MASSWSVEVLFLLLVGVARAQFYNFCTDGIPTPNFADGDVDVILGQAPLFSTNPKIGHLFGLISAYHSSIFFAQGEGSERRYWTMEYDNTAPSFLQGVVPQIIANSSAPGGASLKWRNDARYCLSEGLKWGRAHWTKRFDVIVTITAEQARRAFTDFVVPLNSTASGMFPQYQLFRVATTDFFGRMKKTLVRDNTCNDGVAWFFYYLKDALGVNLQENFVFKATATVFKARSVRAVNTNDPAEMKKMLQYWSTLDDMTAAHKSVIFRLLDLVKFTFQSKYVYDSNAKVYYELSGWSSFFPWTHYIEFPIEGPPWLESSVPASEVATV